MAAPVFEGSSSGFESTPDTTHPITLPASVAEGDLLVLFASVSAEFYDVSVSDDWIRLDEEVLTGEGTNGALFVIYYKVAGESESNPTFTIDFGGVLSWVCHRYSNATVGPVSEWVEVVGTSTDSPNPPAPGAPTTSDDFYQVAFAGWAGNVTLSAYPSGYTEGESEANTQDGVAVAIKQVSSVEDPGPFTLSTATEHCSVTVTIISGGEESIPSGGGDIEGEGDLEGVGSADYGGTFDIEGEGDLEGIGESPATPSTRWFTPQGDCGCCDGGGECTDHVCSSYIHEDGYTVRTIDGTDLEACECFDFDAQIIRTRDRSYDVNVYGTAAGVPITIGGSDYTPSNVDISGTYSFDETSSTFGTHDEFCFTSPTPTHYRLFSEFLTNYDGQDYYAQIYLMPRGLGGELVSGLAVVFTGQPEPTSGLTLQGESWDYDWTDATPCDGNCFCGEFVIHQLENYLTPGAGHDLSGITCDGAEV